MPDAQQYESLAREHWKAHLPKEYQRLKRSSQDQEYFESLGESAFDQYQSLYLQGQKNLPANFLDRWAALERASRQANEIVLNEMILLPDSETAKAIAQGGYRD